MSGWLYAPSDGERAQWAQAELDIYLATPPKARKGLKPLHRPWIPGAKAAAAPVMTPALRSRLKAIANKTLRRGND